jgi:DHA3 family macrolide efflux protein-like MFS transporter
MLLAETERELEPGSDYIDPGPGWQRRYWSIFVGQALSLIGSAMTQFVLMWWITDTTRSVSALATAGMMALLPQALLGPLGGTFADRYPRRLLMIGADAISALCMVVLITLFLTGSIQLWQVYTMMFVRSAMQAFQAPAASASTAMLVPREFLPRAAGLNQTLMGIMTIAAAPLGALAIGVMPIGMALGIDVVTAVLGIVPLLLFAIPQPARSLAGEETGIWKEFAEGFQVVWKNPGLRHLYGLMGAVVLVVMPSFLLAPLLVREHFGGGPSQVALMEGLAGAGMLAGGAIVAAYPVRRLVLWIIFGLAVSSFAIAGVGLAPGHLFWIAVVSWTVSGIAYSVGSGPLTALLQSVVPNHLQGRVLSLLSTVVGLASPVGLALATPIGDRIGVRWLFVAMGVLSGLVCLLGLLSPALLRLEPTGTGDRSAGGPGQRWKSVE